MDDSQQLGSGQLVGLEEAETRAQRELAQALARAIGGDAIVRVEPSVAGARGRPPDLVVLHPEAGLHVIEVKGIPIDQVLGVEPNGEVTFDYGGVGKPKNPLTQARQALFDIKHAAEQRAQKPDLGVPLFPWVVYPAISRHQWTKRFGTVPEGSLLAEDCSGPSLAERVLETGRAKLAELGRSACDRADRVAVNAVFGDHAVLETSAEVRPARRLREGTLGQYFDERSADYNCLSDEQRAVAEDPWEAAPRLVRGVAGSGKTIALAINLARHLHRRLHREPELFPQASPRPRFLAVCFNRALVPFLREKINTAYRQRTGGHDVPTDALEVTHFNGLTYSLARSGVWPYLPVKRDDLTDEQRAAEYRAHLERYRDESPGRLFELGYDAIYVDEGQDLLEDELRILTNLSRPTLTGGEPSVFICYDDAQNLYGRKRPNWQRLGIRVRGRSQVMTTCFRNTPQIVEPAFNVLNGSFASGATGGASRAYMDLSYLEEKGLVTSDENGALRVHFVHRAGGMAPQVRRVSAPDEEADGVAERVRWLVVDQEVRPQDVLVLAPTRKRAEGIAHRIRQAEFLDPEAIHLAAQEKDALIGRRGVLSISTVHSAKGLDAYAVLLAGAERFGTSAEDRATFYVACTRAIEYLEVFAVGSTPLLAELEQAIANTAPPSVRAGPTVAHPSQ